MRYGTYTKDLKGASLTDTDFETAKGFCREGQVVCTEKKQTIGFEIRIGFSRFWEFRLRPRFGYLYLGYLQIDWNKTSMWWADKVVWTPERGEVKE